MRAPLPPSGHICGYFVRDEHISVPARPIDPKSVYDTLVMHSDFNLRNAFEVGFRLRCWQDLLPKGQWATWLEQNAPDLKDSANAYLRLWDTYGDMPRLWISAIDASSLSEALSMLSKANNKPKQTNGRYCPPIKGQTTNEYRDNRESDNY